MEEVVVMGFPRRPFFWCFSLVVSYVFFLCLFLLSFLMSFSFVVSLSRFVLVLFFVFGCAVVFAASIIIPIIKGGV